MRSDTTTGADAVYPAGAGAGAPASATGSAAVADPAGVMAAAAGLLARWWSRPVPEEVAGWPDPAEVEAWARQLGVPPPPGQDPQSVPALLDEYERLFVGPARVPCPPYESYWRDDVDIDLRRSLMGPCTARLRELYRELGLDLSPEIVELPDHVAVEFEALGYALSLTDPGCRPVAQALCRDHLANFLPPLCRALAREAAHPFYAGLAAVTVDWFDRIHRWLVPAAG